MTPVPRFVESGAVRVVVLDDARSVRFYEDASVRFDHVCDRGDRGVIRCAPALRIGEGHQVVADDPLTIVASILCPDCGDHGWVRCGQWVPA